jgi:hypothetical protein
VITDGVSVGERVVVEGFQKVQPGTKVAVVSAPPEPEAAAGADTSAPGAAGNQPPPELPARN